MTTSNANPAGAGGASGDEVVAGTTILSPDPTTSKMNYARALDVALGVALLELHEPDERELEAVRRATRRRFQRQDPEAYIYSLLIERTAPSRECADPLWHRALTTEPTTAATIRERLRGYMPPELIAEAAAAAAAVVHGRLRVKGGRHAA
jgi:hypothetical protein